jgi:hypothetical protein
MAFVSLTRLRVRSVWLLPKFFWYAVLSSQQARKAPGNLGVELLNDTNFAYWTKTLWKDEASMRAFLLSGAHRAAMPVLQQIVDEAQVAHYSADALPDWKEAHRRLQESGKFTTLKLPSADHMARRITPPRT